MTTYTRTLGPSTLGISPKFTRSGTGIGTRLYYSLGGTPETWREENARVGLTISDSITGRTRLMSILISDPRNSKENIYTPYIRVKLVEYLTGLTIFLGRVEFSEPLWDKEYGQVLKLTARDYSYELLERKVSSDYSGAAHLRSEVITHLVEDYRYSVTSITHNIEASGDSLTADKVSRNYTKSGKLALELIEELAKEDPWTSATWGSAGKVWTYIGAAWTDETVNADDIGLADVPLMNAATVDFLYLGQNNPFIGANFTLSTNGAYGIITWEYYNSLGIWATLTKLNNYAFTASGEETWALPSDWATGAVNGTTKYWVRCSVSSKTTQAVASMITCVRGFGYDYYIDDSQVFQYFRRCSRPVLGPSAWGLTVALGEAQTTSKRAMMHDYNFSDQPAEIVTRVTVYGTDSTGTAVSYTETNSVLEASLQITKAKEEFVWGAEMSNAVLTTYCTNRAKALMSYKGTESLTRGEFRIPRYPYFGAVGSETLVRVGDLIHIHCSPRKINDDYLVLEVNYEEPSSLTKIKVVSNIYGRSYSPFETTSILQGLRSGADISVSSAKFGDLMVGNAQIGSLSATKITTGTLSATVTLSGTFQTAAAPNDRFVMDSTGIKAYKGSNQRVQILNDGSGWFGSSSDFSWTNAGVVSINGLKMQAGTVGQRIATDASITDVTGSRVLDTIYQNISGKVMFVTVMVTRASSTTCTLWAKCDANATPTTYVGQITFCDSVSGSTDATISCVVPNNFYYRIARNGSPQPTLNYWIETTIG